MIERREVMKMLALVPLTVAALPGAVRAAVVKVQNKLQKGNIVCIKFNDDSGFALPLRATMIDGSAGDFCYQHNGYESNFHAGDLRSLARSLLDAADIGEGRKTFLIDMPEDRALPGSFGSHTVDADGKLQWTHHLPGVPDDANGSGPYIPALGSTRKDHEVALVRMQSHWWEGNGMTGRLRSVYKKIASG